jgi:hypothetical protein
MRSAALFFAVLVLCLSSTLSFAQGFFADWFNMVSGTQAAQPHWITPLNTTTPRLEQEFRYDIQWQTHNSGVTTDNYGVSKGLEIIPEKNLEVILAVPPYIVNNPDSPQDGFGDWQFLVKYRIAARNEEHGNYILTAFYQMTFPTAQYQEGALSNHTHDCLRKGLQRFRRPRNIGGQPAHRKRGGHRSHSAVE